MLTNVERRERERKRKQKSGDDQAKLNVEESDGYQVRAGRPEKKSKLKFKEASHLPISPVRDQLW